MERVDHSAFLSLSDDELLRQCDVDTLRGSGRGGQKRNKTESAVRLRHRPSGLSVKSDATRSQHKNRAVALRLLRVRIALELRRELSLEGYAPAAELRQLLAGQLGRRSDGYPPAAAELLDLLAAAEGSVSRVAALLDSSTGKLSRLMRGDPALLERANGLRRHRGLRPLR